MICIYIEAIKICHVCLDIHICSRSCAYGRSASYCHTYMFPYCLGTFGVMIALKMILRIVLAATYTCELLSTVSKNKYHNDIAAYML